MKTPRKSLGCLLLAGLLALLTNGCVTTSVALARGGQAQATIVIADEPLRLPVQRRRETLTVAWAAEELQRFVEQASGAKLPIVAASRAPARGRLILVGRSALTRQYGLETPTAPESLRLTSFPRGFAILGEIAPAGLNNIPHELDRGVLAGVYELLERVLGYRFYFHDKDDPELGIVTPRLDSVAIPDDFQLELAPDFPHRVAGFATWSDPPAWMRATREGAATGFHANHTDSQWGQTYGKTNPEFFRLNKDGSRDPKHMCYSEPGVLTQRVKNIETFYAGGRWKGGWNPPRERYIPFVPADWFQETCQCQGCKENVRPKMGRYGKDSEIIFRHGAGLALEVAKRWPSRRVAMLAYEGYMEVPEVEIPENLDVMVCVMRSVTIGKEDHIHRGNMDLMQRWSKKLGGKRERLFVWNYFCWPAFWTEAPLWFPHYLQDWLQQTYAISSGEFINPGGNSPQFEHLMCWLWHRLMWDRNADVDALLHDYAVNFFGPAAAPMEALHRMTIDRYENIKWSRKLDSSYIPAEQMYLETFPPTIIAELEKLAAAAKTAAGPDPKNIYRRRVDWTAEGLAVFFQEAKLAHKWLARAPVYAAASASGEPQWPSVPTALLVQGNYGRVADQTTNVAVVRRGDSVEARFASQLAEPPDERDRIAMRFAATPEDEVSLSIDGTGKVEGELAGELTRSEYRDGVWTAQVKFAAAAIGLDAKRGGKVQAQFERQHRLESKKKRRPKTLKYFWMPPMKPPWDYPRRYGSLVFPPAS